MKSLYVARQGGVEELGKTYGTLKTSVFRDKA